MKLRSMDWIDINRQLPSDEQQVIVAYRGVFTKGAIAFLIYHSESNTFFDGETFFKGDKEWTAEELGITHWQPMLVLPYTSEDLSPGLGYMQGRGAS